MLQVKPKPNHLPLNVYSTPPFPELDLFSANSAIDESFFNSYDAQLVSYPRVGVMDRDRIKFLVSQLKSYPAKLFQTSRTPFIHPHLLSPSMHPVLQDAISASALYASKNQHNEATVWEIISSKVSTLLQEAQHPWSLSTHLACVQALVIFQIIRIFDGDIRQRSDAEMTESTLVEWTTSLSARTNIVNSPPTDSAALWASWVFSETVSRTEIVSLMVQAMYLIQKDGFCTLVDAVTELSFTAHRALWNAPSAQHWQQACDSVPRLNVIRMDFDEMMESASIEDLDELALLMLVTYKGVDGVNEWILKKENSKLID